MFRRRFHSGWVIAVTLSVLWVSPVFAQDPDGVVREVQVKIIKPADLPEPSESQIPTVLSGAAPLPRAANISEIVAAKGLVARNIVQIVAIYPSPSRFQKTRLMAKGHAVWLSAEDGAKRPVLVTAMHWVQGAEEIYAVPWSESQLSAKDNLPRAGLGSINDVISQGSVEAFKKKSPDRVPLKVHEPDEHRNLAALIPDETTKKWFSPPDTGLTFFDVNRHSATQIYGLSPLIGPNVRQTSIASNHRAELVYYLRSDFPGALGAPLFGPEGGVIGITAMRDYKEPTFTLVIPPLALRKYVERLQGIAEDQRVTNKAPEP